VTGPGNECGGFWDNEMDGLGSVTTSDICHIKHLCSRESDTWQGLFVLGCKSCAGFFCSASAPSFT
jgi:hypothetical protein